MDIVDAIGKATQLPTADTAFVCPQKLPFVVILDKTETDGDDLTIRIVDHDLAVEFYAERIDKGNEVKLETFFKKQNWRYTKDRTWLPDERCFETIYLMKFKERV